MKEPVNAIDDKVTDGTSSPDRAEGYEGAKNTERSLTADPPDAGAQEMRDLGTLRPLGILWAMNRLIFHPRGFALALAFAEDDEAMMAAPVGWAVLGDGTEPWSFAEPEDDDGFARFEAFLASLRPATPQE